MKKAIQQIRLLIAKMLMGFAMDVVPKDTDEGKRLFFTAYYYFKFDKDDLPY